MSGLLDDTHGLRVPRLRNYALHALHALGLRRWRERLVEKGGLAIAVREGTHDEVIVREVWDERIYPLDGLELGAGDVVVDAGAQIGSFTLLAAATGARVVALEPSPLNLARLRANVARNDFEDRAVVRAEALARPGVREVDLSLTYTNLGGHSTIAWLGPRRRVPCTSLEVLFEREGIARCRVLKLDVEGLECPVLYTAPEGVLARIDALFAEVIEHPATAAERRAGEPPHDHEGLVRFLEERGFAVFWDPRTRVVAARRTR